MELSWSDVAKRPCQAPMSASGTGAGARAPTAGPELVRTWTVPANMDMSNASRPEGREARHNRGPRPDRAQPLVADVTDPAQLGITRRSDRRRKRIPHCRALTIRKPDTGLPAAGCKLGRAVPPPN